MEVRMGGIDKPLSVMSDEELLDEITNSSPSCSWFELVMVFIKSRLRHNSWLLEAERKKMIEKFTELIEQINTKISQPARIYSVRVTSLAIEYSIARIVLLSHMTNQKQ